MSQNFYFGHSKSCVICRSAKFGCTSSDVSCQLGDGSVIIYDFLSPICFYYVFVYTTKSCVFHGANDKLMAFWEVHCQCGKFSGCTSSVDQR